MAHRECPRLASTSIYTNCVPSTRQHDFYRLFRAASRVIASGLARWRRFSNAMLRFSAHARSRHPSEFVSLASILYGTQPFTAHSPSASGLSSHQAHSTQASPLFLNLTLSSKSRHLTTCDCASLPRVPSAQVAVALFFSPTTSLRNRSRRSRSGPCNRG